MTKRDHALLEFAGFVRAHHSIPPTVREFAELLDHPSRNQGHYWARELMLAGYIAHAISPESARDLYLTPSGDRRVARLLAEGAAA